MRQLSPGPEKGMLSSSWCALILIHVRNQCTFSESSQSCDRCLQNKYDCTTTDCAPQPKRRKLSAYKCEHCRRLKQKVCQISLIHYRSLSCSVYQKTELGQRGALGVYKAVFHVRNLKLPQSLLPYIHPASWRVTLLLAGTRTSLKTCCRFVSHSGCYKLIGNQQG